MPSPPSPTPPIGFAQRLLVAYSVIVPALAIVGVPSLFPNAAWLGRPLLAPLAPFLGLCSSVAGILYLGLASHRREFPRNPWWCLVLVFDTPALVALSALLTGRADLGVFGWDGLLELCGVMLAATAMWGRTQPRRDGLVMGALLGAFGALAPLTLLLLLLENWTQAAVMLTALTSGAVTWFHLLTRRKVAEQTNSEQNRWLLIGVAAVLAAIAYSAWRVVR